MLGILDFLQKELEGFTSNSNPLAGFTAESGDKIISTLLDEEYQVLCLAAWYSAQTVVCAEGVQKQFWTKETQNKVDRFVNLSQLLQGVVRTNIQHRLGWKYFNIGFCEDRSIVTFGSVPEVAVTTFFVADGSDQAH